MIKFLKVLFGFALSIALFLVVVGLMSVNSQVVEVDLIVIPVFAAGLGKILVATFVLGGVLGLLTGSLMLFKQYREKAKLERRIKNSARLMSSLNA